MLIIRIITILLQAGLFLAANVIALTHLDKEAGEEKNLGYAYFYCYFLA